MRWSGELHFTDVRQLDRGSYGQVYAARLVSADGIARDVVVKLARGNTPEEVAQSRRFLLEEARLTAMFNHPNIIRFIDYNTVELNGERVPCLILEHGGVPLSALIRSHGGRLEPGLASFIGVGVLAGLAHSHERHIIHRDVKPGNVLIGPHGQVKLIDYGIAKAADCRNPSTVVTNLKGTPVYISPEAYRGWKLDGRADLWAVGVMLYEMLMGRHPWEVNRGEANEVVRLRQLSDMVMKAPLPEMPKELVPTEIGEVVTKLLMKSRDDRYEDALTAMYALEKVARPLIGPWGAARELGQQALAAEEPLARCRVPAADASTANVRASKRQEDYVSLVVQVPVSSASIVVPPEMLDDSQSSDVLPSLVSDALPSPESNPSAELPEVDNTVQISLPPLSRYRRSLAVGIASFVVLATGLGGMFWWDRSTAANAGASVKPTIEARARLSSRAIAQERPAKDSAELVESSGTGDPVLVDSAPVDDPPTAGDAGISTAEPTASKHATEPRAEVDDSSKRVGVGALEVVLLPRGAFVSLDGRPPVKAPVTFPKVRQGAHTVRVGLEEKALDRIEKVVVKAGDVTRLRVELANPFGE